MSRDSLLLYLGAAAALLTYLLASAPPTEWGYFDWLKAAAFVVAYGIGKLQSSPLKGAGE